MIDSPCRWFRFRLSTIFVLVAIAAWLMACQPFYRFDECSYYLNGAEYEAKFRPFEEITILISQFELGHITPDTSTEVYSISFNRDLCWPILALFAFIAWKGAWAIVARR